MQARHFSKIAIGGGISFILQNTKKKGFFYVRVSESGSDSSTRRELCNVHDKEWCNAESYVSTTYTIINVQHSEQFLFIDGQWDGLTGGLFFVLIVKENLIARNWAQFTKRGYAKKLTKRWNNGLLPKAGKTAKWTANKRYSGRGMLRFSSVLIGVPLNWVPCPQVHKGVDYRVKTKKKQTPESSLVMA